MFNRKTKELENVLAQREQELAILAKKVETLTASVEEYKTNESAIAGALTNAQRAADRILAETDTKQARILEESVQLKLDAEEEAKDIIAEANLRAETIVSDAKEKARAIALQAEAFMDEYRSTAEKLNASLKDAAAAAAAQAESFRAFAEGVVLEAETEISSEYASISALLEEKPLDLPEDYEEPATLMKSIYTIQNRDIPTEDAPADAAPEQAEEAEPERVWTVDEIVDDKAEEGDSELDAELNAIINDVLKDS